MRIGVAATPAVALPSLEWLLTSKHTLVKTITVPDKPSGRGRVLSASPVGTWSQEHGIECIKPAKSVELVGHLEDLDLVITIGYGVILPEQILALPKYGFINLHFSLLPLYRGAAPAQRALHNGDTETGITVFALDKGMDTGPIYVSHSCAIDASWRASELLDSLALMGPQALSQACQMIEDGVAPVAQVGNSTLAPKISVEEACVNFNLPASQVTNAIRAFYPAPGAWSVFRGDKMKFSRVNTAHIELELIPGQIHFDGKRVFIGCGDKSAIEVSEIVPAGKSEMIASDWARGARLAPGEKIG